MKTNFLKLIPLTVIMLLVGCNEIVSDELKDGNSVTTGGSSTGGVVIGAPTFKVINTSPVILNYKLHKTGFDSVSNRELDCQVTGADGVPFTNAQFDAEEAISTPHDQKVFDISCFMEVEELSLYHSGFSFAVEASANACNYVGYSPFSYFSMIPGSSTTTYRKLTCPEEATATPPGQNGQACGSYRNAFGPGGGAAEKFSTSLPQAPEDEKELCRFDYTKIEGPNCDNGIITVLDYNYSLSIPSDSNSPLVASGTPKVRKIKCGGKPANCVNGAIRDLPAAAKATSYTEIGRTAEDAVYNVDRTFAGQIGKASSNRKYVNYRRNIASENVKYGNQATASAAYNTAFNSLESFNPNLIANYAQNKKMDLSNSYVSPALIGSYSDASFYKSEPYASEPFMSVHKGYPINPFYTFTCLDKAFEPKARIRVVVREWDRIFSDPATSTQFDFLSDIFEGDEATQDNTFEDSYGDNFDDLGDWDDLIVMSRSGTTFDNTTTNYTPLYFNGVSWVDGWFQPKLFPYDLLDQTDE